MHLQDSQLPVWRQLQQHCAATPEGKAALQQDEARQQLQPLDVTQPHGGVQ
jgi:hypothetical protein